MNRLNVFFRILLVFFAIFLDSPLQAGEILNKHLPKWVQLDLEFRHRYEFQNNFDFNDVIDDDAGFSLWRTRLGISLLPDENTKFFYQMQDARISNDKIDSSKVAYENWGDLRQLWMQRKTAIALDAVQLSALTLKFGRQDLSYGSQRLLGPVNWSNVGQTFDSGKFLLEFAPIDLTVDIFGGHKTNNKSPREFDDLYDGSADDLLGGYYATFKGVKDVTIEQYVISRNTDGKTVSFGQTGDGEVEDYTIGARVVGKIPETSWDYEFETAKQVGNSGSLDVDAQMAVAILGYTFSHDWKPRVAFEYDYASGDHDSTDGDRETFDNLYPTNHLFYGYMDFASLQNIQNYHFLASVKPYEKLQLQADLHLLYLDTPKNHLFSAGRTIKRSTTAGADDSEVGQEIDLTAKWKACGYADFLVGYSHFFAGNFLKDTGASDDADYFYIQSTFSF